MSKGNLPHFSARTGWGSVSASAMNRLVDLVAKTEARVTAAERELAGDDPFKRTPLRPKTVVITKKPLDGDKFLTVREAGYSTIPPKPCVGDLPVVCFYEWYGIDFEVFPPLGKDAIDYEGDEQVPADAANPPKFESKFHRCHREHEVWVLDDVGGEGGGGIIPARVLTAVTGATTISVQPLKRDPNPPQTAWINDGASIIVPLWGDQRGNDFGSLIGDIIPLVIIAGEKYAMQYIWFFTKNPNTAIPAGDCAL